MRSVFECEWRRLRPFRLPQVARSALALYALAAASACSVDAVMRPEVDVGMQTATVSGRGLQALVPSYPPPEPMDVSPAAVPAPLAAGPDPSSSPAVPPIAPSSPVITANAAVLPAAPMTMSYPLGSLPQPPAMSVEPPAPTLPESETACRRELQRLGVTYHDLAPINDGGACRIDHPVKVSGFSGNIALKPAATLTCQMALTVARWTKNELGPAARKRYFSGIGTIRQGSSYSCRRIRGTGVASEHSKGNALDIMSITLKNGREIDIRRPGFFAFRQRGLLKTVRAEGCEYFTTVLGPGYDADHKDHFHFDIKARRNGYRACR